MIEELLAYQSPSAAPQSFTETAADVALEPDARLLYEQMAADIAAVATALGRGHHRARIVRMLRTALAAEGHARAASWRHLYRELADLLADDPFDAMSRDDRAGGSACFTRLRAFLRENVDLADALAIEQLECDMRRRMARA